MPVQHLLGLDIGSNSVGSVWIDLGCGQILTGTSIFPAGVVESDEKRGDPKNAARRMARRARITLRRRAQRKRQLRLRLIGAGLLPSTAEGWKTLLGGTDPWELRRVGLDRALSPHEFGRVLLHLSQRRGASGLATTGPLDGDEPGGATQEDGEVIRAIGEVQAKMLAAKVRTFGEFVASQREQRVHRLPGAERGPSGGRREYRDRVRNTRDVYEHCADRAMIREEFGRLWAAQKRMGGPTAALLTDELRLALDDPDRTALDKDPTATEEQRRAYKQMFKEGGLLFGQRRATWDAGMLGRCDLEPTERCVPHADRHASRFRVVEMVNNLRVIERGKPVRPLTPEEREKVLAYLSGPLGMTPARTVKGKQHPPRPKQSVSVTDLRELMGWGRATKNTPVRFSIESDENREINTDWFAREIVHGAIGVEAWSGMSESLREGINRVLLKRDPAEGADEAALRAGLLSWGGLSATQAGAVIEAWKRRPSIKSKRLKLGRRAVRNLLTVMDRPEPWPDPHCPSSYRWLTQIEARKVLAEDGDFRDVTTGEPMDAITRRRYATGAKGATARDRHYMGKHVLMKDGRPVIGPDGRPLAEPPPAPLIANPVVRKAIHEVRRHLVEFMTTFGRKPDQIRIELSREARLGAKDADRALFRNRLRDRIRRDIIEHFGLDGRTPTQQEAATLRVVLWAQQGGRCPLCGGTSGTLTPRAAADGEGCEVAHIIPRGGGGDNGQSNLVLSHTECNREMARRTPREYWNATLPGGFAEGYARVEGLYGEIARPRPTDAVRKAGGAPLWACYFDVRDDRRKLEQFAKDVKDIQGMTPRQEAATRYAARQVMAYLADALYDGKGLPERSMGEGDPEGQRRIFTTDGLWTGRLRREWGLFFDAHGAAAKGLEEQEEHRRKQKNRGDHRHHAVDAVVVALSTRAVQLAWDERERAAEAAGINTADAEAMERYRRANPIPPPEPFGTREEFREAVRRAVFGDGSTPRPICHRPVKRKLIGPLHKPTMYGPVLNPDGTRHPSFVTVRMRIADLKPAHLRVPPGWDELTARFHAQNVPISERTRLRASLAALRDPAPGPGLVRDRTTRDFLRRWLRDTGLSLGVAENANYRVRGGFTDADLRRVLPRDQAIPTPSGVPLRTVVVIRAIAEPPDIPRRRWDPKTNEEIKESCAAAVRLYDLQNNHHIEIRMSTGRTRKTKWTGTVVTAYEAAMRKLARLKQFKAVGVPKPDEFRCPGVMSEADKRSWRPIIAAIERAHPIVNRADDEALGGRFVMSLCEGETLYMRHKWTKEPGYFVVAKLDKPQSVVLVPDWDARAAGPRKDSSGKPVPDSQRESFTATPSDLASLAPPGHPHAVKVRVSPLGVVTVLHRD